MLGDACSKGEVSCGLGEVGEGVQKGLRGAAESGGAGNLMLSSCFSSAGICSHTWMDTHTHPATDLQLSGERER